MVNKPVLTTSIFCARNFTVSAKNTKSPHLNESNITPFPVLNNPSIEQRIFLPETLTSPMKSLKDLGEYPRLESEKMLVFLRARHQ